MTDLDKLREELGLLPGEEISEELLKELQAMGKGEEKDGEFHKQQAD